MNKNIANVIWPRLATTGMVLVLFGCASRGPLPNDPYYSPVIPSVMSVAPLSNGSLFTDTRSMNLYGDRKARSVGDIITVLLQENTVSKKSSTVGIKKDSDTVIPEAAGAAGTLLGGAVSMKGLSLGTNLSAERDFKGAADAAQSNNLSGNVTVSVVEVLPNGTLAIRGEKWLTLNRGDEFIRFSGYVRPEDVSSDNTVMSTKVANARIIYAGTGSLADSQKMGWLSRFFNSEYWPF